MDGTEGSTGRSHWCLWGRCDDAVYGFQSMISIISSQNSINRNSCLSQRCHVLPSTMPPCRIGGAIGSIRANSCHKGIFHAFQIRCGSKGQFLISAAFAFASQMHHCFAATKNGTGAFYRAFAFSNVFAMEPKKRPASLASQSSMVERVSGV